MEYIYIYNINIWEIFSKYIPHLIYLFSFYILFDCNIVNKNKTQQTQESKQRQCNVTILLQ